MIATKTRSDKTSVDAGFSVVFPMLSDSAIVTKNLLNVSATSAPLDIMSLLSTSTISPL